jgi:type I restriction enzyme M protein
MELEFHWREDDNPIDFQVRLINLHKNGLLAFLEKEVAGIEDSDFEGYKNAEELLERKKKILKFNNIFAIKEVDDDETFENNQRVLKEVVQLLEKYQIRYPRKQQHLSDFFELLLTTGLKQEVGQYFTPPPVTKFIVRSLPIKKMMLQEINNQEPRLPAVIDYAAGSGHFITEALEEYQDIINNIDIDKELKFPKAKSAVQSWVADPYNWAAKYVYGIEKDYRLVKVAKVGCYFYGDGVAQIIHGDGLDSFATSKTYKGLLKENINIEDSSKAKFSVVISNPPYAVNDCKDDLEYIGAQKEYTLYQSLSDKSKDIECLFVERTKHLLKDGGVASLILPSSILNNTGIQTKTREIILQYFDIVAIAELGSNTFMATGTNTVTLFLRRRANKLSAEWKKSVAHFFENLQDITINGIEKPVSKYVNYVWSTISFSDYISLLEKTPNEAIQNHEIYKEYRKKLKAKTEKDFWNVLLDREADKLFYFIIALNQKVVLVKSGEKEAEKRFLGYEFSSRRNSEGMHAMQRDKTVDECTQMYDAKLFDNPEKASTYILKAFTGKDDFEIDAKMQNHISRHDLVDMMTFDRVDFEKTILLSVKKKVKYENIWGSNKLYSLGEIAEIKKGTSITKDKTVEGKIPVIAGGQEPAYFHNESNRENQTITISASGAYAGFINYFEIPIFASDCNTIISKNETIVSTKLIYLFLKSIQNEIYGLQRGQAQPHVYGEDLSNVKIPLPPINIQQKIVAEIEVLEAKEKKVEEEVEKLKNEASSIFNFNGEIVKLQDITTKIGSGATPRGGESAYKESGITLIRSMNVYDNEFYLKGLAFIDEEQARKLNNVTVEENDILFNITGASVCRCCIVENKYLPARVNQHVSIIRTNEKALPKFVQQLLISSKFKTELLELADNSSTREAITKQQLEDFKIPLPSLAEQQKIVSEIEKIEEKINVLEKEIAEIPKQKEAVLKKYL